jgi:hypothetical protein
VTDDHEAQVQALLAEILACAERILSSREPDDDLITGANSAHKLARTGSSDVREDVGTLFRLLKGLGDQDRRQAFTALFGVLRGVESIAGAVRPRQRARRG